MSLQKRIQDWLGITALVNHHINMQRDIAKANRTLDTIGPGLGRVIAKLDAKYAEDEMTPERKAESDKLAEETIRRLHAEAAARAPYNDPA